MGLSVTGKDGQREMARRIGERVRWARLQRGWTQARLGEAIGIKFQQVQKYENGSNRVSAPMLFAIARALGMPVSEFFASLEEGAPAGPLLHLNGTESRQLLDLCRVFQRIKDPLDRRFVVDAARRFAAPASDD